MTKEATTAGGTQAAILPWLAFYPENAPAEVEASPYRLLGDAARDWRRQGRRQGVHGHIAERPWRRASALPISIVVRTLSRLFA